MTREKIFIKVYPTTLKTKELKYTQLLLKSSQGGKMFTGSMVALVTPFKDGRVDEEQIPKLVEFQLKAGTDVICPCGCTGEAATLSHNEQLSIIDIVVRSVAGNAKVVAGTGSNSTAEAVRLTRGAKDAGADGVLVITPYYNKPPQAGLIEHYKRVADVGLPVMLYNVPSRTGVEIHPETVAELSKVENIVALKEAGGSVDRVSAILNLCDISVLSGDDSLTLPMMAVGAKGVVSVAANVDPTSIKRLVDTANTGHFATARDIHFKLFPLFKALFLETNPIPLKQAMGWMQLCNNELRPPLTRLQTKHQRQFREALIGLGLY